MKEIKQIIEAYVLANAKHQKSALATVVHVEGSSYRGPGARMLITEEGILTGAISGGCLEGDALRKALMVMIEGKPLLTTYDTSDEEDAVIGVGLGCNGIISVLIEPIDSLATINPITLLQAVVERRLASVLVTFFSKEDKRSLQQGTHLLVRMDGTVHIGAELLEMDSVLDDANGVIENRQSCFITYSAGMEKQENRSLIAFLEYITPSIALVVAGAGNDVFPLVRIAEVLGWEITLVDGRLHYANGHRFPSCNVIVTAPEEALSKITIDERTALVLMTHNYMYDKTILGAVLKKSLPYVGMLGPKKKLDRILQELENEGLGLVGSELLSVYSPIGLDIGAETPDEIALSIIAEIKAVFAEKRGTYLRDTPNKIHDRETAIVR